jgi:hypothetical protein
LRHALRISALHQIRAAACAGCQQARHQGQRTDIDEFFQSLLLKEICSADMSL